MRKNRIRASRGFTLIEILIVLVIIGTLAAFIVPNITDKPDQAKATRAQADINTISSALEMYKLDNGNYPSSEQGLAALVEMPTTDPVPMSWKPGGYLKTKNKAVPLDPWNTPYVYRQPGTDGAGFDLISLGADRKEGGEGYDADVSNN